jgi:U3 small nucleolar RNA-associated protein 11
MPSSGETTKSELNLKKGQNGACSRNTRYASSRLGQTKHVSDVQLLRQDYSLRAADYNAKKARLRILREKAALRNPDEFYYGMLNAKTDKAGRKIADRGNKALSTDAVRLLKTQDQGYLRLMSGRARKERERAEEAWTGEGGEVKVIGAPNDARKGKVIFVDSVEEQRNWRPEASEQHEGGGVEEEEDEAIDVKDLRKAKREAQREAQRLKEDRALRKKLKRHQDVRPAAIESTKKQERELVAVERELELQRAKMGKSVLVGGINKLGVKFRPKERRRR